MQSRAETKEVVELLPAPSVATSTARGRNYNRARISIINIAVLLLFVLCWQLAAELYRSPFVPPPSAVWHAAIKLATQGDVNGYTLWAHAAMSLLRVLAGFGAAGSRREYPSGRADCGSSAG